ncbi:Hypothetical_protein [Hexamita inflata]|uniref:Hypothetical_protein n=1 Tax=Hexamita inflata TaxID=28002 RepID=A0AA86QWH3_9EUKA|nr:Hypothetical protein HINF_LOCUS52137 [Hexamita inflata]
MKHQTKHSMSLKYLKNHSLPVMQSFTRQPPKKLLSIFLSQENLHQKQNSVTPKAADKIETKDFFDQFRSSSSNDSFGSDEHLQELRQLKQRILTKHDVLKQLMEKMDTLKDISAAHKTMISNMNDDQRWLLTRLANAHKYKC